MRTNWLVLSTWTAAALTGCDLGAHAPTAAPVAASATAPAPPVVAPAPAAVAAPAPPSPTSSAACFNEAAFTHAGSVIDHEYTVAGDGATPPRRVRATVQGPATHEGEAAVATRVEYFDDGGAAAGHTLGYHVVRDGFYQHLGLVNPATGLRQRTEPMRREKIDMQPGERFSQDYASRNTLPGRPDELSQTQLSTTYVGREPFTGPLGTVEACKFTVVEDTHAQGGSAIRYHIEQTRWSAAAGPYRGLVLRTQTVARYSAGVTVRQTMDTTRVREYSAR